MPKAPLQSLQSKLELFGLRAVLVQDNLEIVNVSDMGGLPTSTDPIQFAVAKPRPVGCPGRGPPEGYNLEDESTMTSNDFKEFRKLCRLIAQHTPLVNMTQAASFQKEAVELCIRKFLKLQPHFEAYKPHGYWIISAMYSTILRGSSSRVQQKANKAKGLKEELKKLLASGEVPPEPIKKPRKPRGRPRKAKIPADDEAPLDTLPVALKPSPPPPAQSTPPADAEQGEFIDISVDDAKVDTTMHEAVKSFRGMTIDGVEPMDQDEDDVEDGGAFDMGKANEPLKGFNDSTSDAPAAPVARAPAVPVAHAPAVPVACTPAIPAAPAPTVTTATAAIDASSSPNAGAAHLAAAVPVVMGWLN